MEPGQTAEERHRLFIEQINAENEGLSVPSPEPYFIESEPDPIGFLIARVDNVVVESTQIFTEPLTSKAQTLAELYQAKALQDIAGAIIRLDDTLRKLVGHFQSIIGQVETPAHETPRVRPGPPLRDVERQKCEDPLEQISKNPRTTEDEQWWKWWPYSHTRRKDKEGGRLAAKDENP